MATAIDNSSVLYLVEYYNDGGSNRHYGSHNGVHNLHYDNHDGGSNHNNYGNHGGGGGQGLFINDVINFGWYLDPPLPLVIMSSFGNPPPPPFVRIIGEKN